MIEWSPSGKGEVLGLGGLVGAGRTELAQMIFGDVQKMDGQFIFNGEEINPRSPREAIDLGIALVPEDRKRHGALTNGMVLLNISSYAQMIVKGLVLMFAVGFDTFLIPHVGYAFSVKTMFKCYPGGKHKALKFS